MEKGHGGGRGMGGRRGGKRRKERGVAPWVQEGIDAPGARNSSFVKQTRSVNSLFTLRIIARAGAAPEISSYSKP